MEEIHDHVNAASTFSRMVSGMPASRILRKRGQHQGHDDHDDDGGGGGGFESNGNNNRDKNQLVGWHNASRIVRVSRVSGGKDRHSKVWTSRGLRDRRIRLSVTTAIRFYDLQDRLGYDQPSKAVEWLIKAAADPIADLPSLNGPFPATPNAKDADLDGGEDGSLGSFHQQKQQRISFSKSSAAAAALCTCSSASDTSKGSGLSLSRTDVQVSRTKAREPAKERASKDRECDKHNNSNNNNVSPNSHKNHNNNNVSSNSPGGNINGSFTELLAGPASAVHHFDYFNSLQSRPNSSSGIFGQMQLGNPFPFNVGGEQQSELHHFSALPVHDHLIPVSSTPSQRGNGGCDNHPNFTVSSGSGGGGGLGLSARFNRGTLQSNLPSVWPPHMLQRLSTADAINSFPFLLGGATATATAPVESHAPTNHHPFSSGFDSRLLFGYGDAARHNSDQKDKGKH